MDAILDKLTEIENAASAIVRHAEEQKDVRRTSSKPSSAA